MIKKSVFMYMFFSIISHYFSILAISPQEGKILSGKVVTSIKSLLQGKEHLISKMIESRGEALAVFLGIEELRALSTEEQEKLLIDEKKAAQGASWHIISPIEDTLTAFRKLSKIINPLIEESLGINALITRLVKTDPKTPIKACLDSKVYDMATLKQFCEELIKLVADFEKTFDDAFKKGHAVLEKEQTTPKPGQQAQARS